MKNILLKTPLKIWLISVVILLTPIIADVFLRDSILFDEHLREMLWLLTILPSIFVSYYTGFKGGFCITGVSIIIHLMFKFIELFWINSFDAHDIQLLVLLLIIQVVIVVSIGIMTEKLAEKELKLKQLNHKLEKLMITDELTGLYNRRGFLRLSEQAIRSNPSSVCLYIDLDGFKCVNDRYGHFVGDQLLKVIAKRIVSCTRKEDIAGRLGGDEFVCILINSDQNRARSFASRLINVLSEPILIRGEQLVVTPSIGIAVSPFDGKSTEELLNNADMAMYDAKKQGKNNYSFFKSF